MATNDQVRCNADRSVSAQSYSQYLSRVISLCSVLNILHIIYNQSLFIWCLFNNSVRSEEYVALNGKLITK